MLSFYNDFEYATRESAAKRSPLFYIYDLDPNGKAAQAYENLTREVLNIGRQPKKHRSDLTR